MNKKISRCLFTAILLTMCLTSISQELNTEEQIDEVIISAKRSEQNITDVGRSVTVIKSQEIKQSIYSNVSDLLTFKAGINILGSGQNPGSLQSIYLRGSGVNQTVIMINGVRINDPSTVNNAIDLSELSLINIERIEIVRGTHSTLYGSSAIGGVINIITKNKKEKGFHIDTEIKTGTFGKSTFELSETIDLSYSGNSGFYAIAEIFNTNINGSDATIDTITDMNVYKNRDTDNFDKLDLSGKLGLNNKKWDVFASYKYTNQKADLDDGAFTDDDNHKLMYSRELISYKASYIPSKRLKLKFLGGYTNLIRTVTDDSSKIDAAGTYDHAFAKDTYFGTVINNEIQADYNIKAINILLGFGRFEDKMNSESYYLNSAWMLEIENNLDSLNLKSFTNTGFIHFNISGESFSEKMKFFTLNIGGRYNNHSTFRNYFTYEINPLIKIGKHFGIYGTYSTGFNTPSLYQLFSPSTNYISGIQRGNINLKPESSGMYETGISFYSKKLKLNLSLYNTQIDNLIEYVYLWDKSIPVADLGSDWLRDDYRGDTYLNLGKEDIKGIEFRILANLHKKITISANLTLLKGDINFNPDQNKDYNDFHIQLFSTGDFLNKTINIKGLTRRSNTANIILNYMAFKNITLSGDIKYRGKKEDVFYNPSLGPYGALGKTELDNYALLGFNVNYQLKNQFFITLRIDNILNSEYQELTGYTSKGRGFYLKLRYRF